VIVFFVKIKQGSVVLINFFMKNNHFLSITFPKITPDRLALKIKPIAEKMLRKEHPWLFESAITKQSGEGKAGDLAIIYDQKKNKFLALGLYDPYSPIRVKLLQFKKGATINEDWFTAKIDKAYALRESLLATDTNSYRLLHGESDGFPSFIADVYADVLVIKIYSLIWLPYLEKIMQILITKTNCQTAVLRLSRNVQQQQNLLHGLHDGQVIYGKLDNEAIIFKEHGLKFSANVVRGHKTGYFLDHRHNRKTISDLAKGKSVIDFFAYAGGFSVHALAGGATEVVSVDISAQALEMAKKNVALNDLQNAPHETMAIDAFEAFQKLNKARKQFDIVVVDPPSFAKKDSEREKAINSYARLAKLALKLVKPNGILFLASCSSRVKAEEFFDNALRVLATADRKITELERTFHDVDHPINPNFPEGAYLKSIYFRVD